jgi:hypothetical protein
VKGSSLRIRLFLTLDTAGVEVMAIHRAELPSSAARRFVNSFAVDSVCEVSSLLRCSLDSWSQVHHVFVFFTLANSHSYDSEMLRVADVDNTYTYTHLYRQRRAHVRSQIITGIANTRRCLGRYFTSETLEHGTRATNILIVNSPGAARQRHGHSIYCTNAYVWYMLTGGLASQENQSKESPT